MSTTFLSEYYITQIYVRQYIFSYYNIFMSIINVFNSEMDLFSGYPKQFYFQLKNIFNDYWYDFLDFANSKNLTIRPVVLRNVEHFPIR